VLGKVTVEMSADRRALDVEVDDGGNGGHGGSKRLGRILYR
jgi:hypothetical protein